MKYEESRKKIHTHTHEKRKCKRKIIFLVMIFPLLFFTRKKNIIFRQCDFDEFQKNTLSDQFKRNFDMKINLKKANCFRKVDFVSYAEFNCVFFYSVENIVSFICVDVDIDVDVNETFQIGLFTIQN